MKHQNIRRIPQSNQLQRTDMFLARGAIPCIVRVQLLSGCELIETIFQRNGRTVLRRDNREGYGRVDIKLDGLPPAAGTRQVRPVHTLRIIHKNTIMSQQVLPPRFHRGPAIVHSIRFHLLHIWLAFHAVQVLMQSIHQILTKFLTVVLNSVVELRSKAAHRLLQQSWRQYRKFSRPYIIQKGGVRSGHSSTASKRIFLVHFLQIITL
mmetsp:Transcript_10496/g.18618  ORF Transcript_10496/g.18618 Transcript_10496/m.18618 type:complete len:208 (+) Transcript_10496:513-1136(+)